MPNKNKIAIIVVSLLLVFTIFISISYAYWRITHTQTTSNKIATSCFSMELANEKNDITLESAYPISDEKGKALTPYSFTITNTCDLFASYTINLEMLEGTTLNSKYIKTMINNEAITNLNALDTTDTSIEGAVESRILFKGSLGSGDSTDYTFRLWMDSETPATDESMNKVFQAKISIIAEVSSYSPVENGFNKLAEALLVNEYQTTSLSVAKDKIASKQSVDFTKTAPTIDWQELTLQTPEELSIRKINPSEIDIYNIDENASKVLLGRSYSFDSETGYYTLEDTAYYNPSTHIYTNSNYYICNSTVTVSSDNTIKYYDTTKCATLYRISDLVSTKSGTIKLSDGTIIATQKYIYKVYKMYEIELESDKSDKGLYEAEDDHGTSYYYRGNVTNNYVKFANYYWRVIRINGDGSTRLLYAGTTSKGVGAALGIGTAQFNELRTNPTYVGYMYSNTLNTTYEDTIANDNDSTIKSKLDVWYKTNVVDTGYNKYVADSGFCNDRSIASNSPGLGVTTSETTYYATRYRIMNHNPTFNCYNSNNDLFTLSGNTKGNQNLTYPIGLITIDELAFAGLSYGYLNKMSYTYSSESFWTMSPFNFGATAQTSDVWRAVQDGTVGGHNVANNISVRPVINLNADIEITGGIGTKNDPFVIKTN